MDANNDDKNKKTLLNCDAKVYWETNDKNMLKGLESSDVIFNHAEEGRTS